MIGRPMRLIARTLLRAWRRHPLRAVAASLGVVLGAALATLVVSINDAVSHAARAANGTDVIHADLAVRARSAGGVAASLGPRLRVAIPGARIAPVLQVNSRLAGSDGRDPAGLLSVLGVDSRVGAFFPRARAQELIVRREKPGAPGLLVGTAWLRRNDHSVGDRIRLLTGRGVSAWTIVGQIPGDLPNDGALAAGGIRAVGRAFDRVGVVDAYYVLAPPGDNLGALADRLRDAVGPAGTVGPPSVVGEMSARSLRVVQAMLYVAGLVGLLSAATVVFVCWRLLLENERASIARFRLTGATPAQLAGGAGLVLLAATVAFGAVGVLAGILCERLLRGVTGQLIGFTGLAAVPRPSDLGRPALAGLVGAIAMSGAAWLAAVRAFVRSSALEAVRPPDPPPPTSAPLVLQVSSAASAMALAAATLVWLPLRMAPVAIVLTLAGACVLTIAAPRLLGRVLAAPNSDRGFVRLAAGRHLTADARRSAAVILMVGLSVAAGLTLTGVAGSYAAAIERSVRSWTHADLFVRLGRPGATLRDARFPPRVQRDLARLPGVQQAGAFTYLTLDYEHRNVMLQAYDTDHIAGIADLIVYEGVRGAGLWRALDGGAVAVSESMARLDGLSVGDTVTIPGAHGARRCRIAAIIDDYVSEGGTIVASLRTYAQLTGEQRIDDIPLKLASGVSTADAAQRVRAALPQYESLTLLDRPSFRASVTAFIANVVALFRGLALAAFFIVLLASTLTLAASLAVRRRALGVAQMLGASPQRIRMQLCAEAIVMALSAWAVAVLTAALLILGTLRAMAAQTGLLPRADIPFSEAAIALPLALGVVVTAALLVARMTFGQQVTKTLSVE